MGFKRSKEAQKVFDRLEAIKQGMSVDQAGKDRRRRLPILRLSILLWVVLTAILFLVPARGNAPVELGLGSFINDILFKATPPYMTGDRVIDRVLASALQAGAVFFCAGILPFLAHMWITLRDRALGNPLVSFWGVSVGIPFCWVTYNDFVAPMIKDITGG